MLVELELGAILAWFVLGSMAIFTGAFAALYTFFTLFEIAPVFYDGDEEGWD